MINGKIMVFSVNYGNNIMLPLIENVSTLKWNTQLLGLKFLQIPSIIYLNHTFNQEIYREDLERGHVELFARKCSPKTEIKGGNKL